MPDYSYNTVYSTISPGSFIPVKTEEDIQMIDAEEISSFSITDAYDKVKRLIDMPGLDYNHWERDFISSIIIRYPAMLSVKQRNVILSLWIRYGKYEETYNYSTDKLTKPNKPKPAEEDHVRHVILD